jgi:DNA-binding MarR family transcriptional regulator
MKIADMRSESLGNELRNPLKKLPRVTIARVNLLSTRINGRLLREAGIKEISPEQARILNILWKVDVTGVGPIPTGILARETQLSKPTLSIMLNRLEKKGYITRSPSETDQRVSLVKRTGKDKHLEQAYADISDRMSKILYDGFTSGEINQFETYSERILNNLIQNSIEKRS